MGQHCVFKAEITGMAAVKEHLPKPDKSFITAIFFIVTTLLALLLKHSLSI